MSPETVTVIGMTAASLIPYADKWVTKVFTDRAASRAHELAKAKAKEAAS